MGRLGSTDRPPSGDARNGCWIVLVPGKNRSERVSAHASQAELVTGIPAAQSGKAGSLLVRLVVVDPSQEPQTIRDGRRGFAHASRRREEEDRRLRLVGADALPGPQVDAAIPAEPDLGGIATELSAIRNQRLGGLTQRPVGGGRQ